MTGAAFVSSVLAVSVRTPGIGVKVLGALVESEIATGCRLSEMDPTGGSSAGGSVTAGKAAGAAGSETTGAGMLGVAVPAGGRLVGGILVEGKDGGLPSPVVTARSRFGRAGNLAGDEAGAGASGSHAGLSGAVVGNEGAGATGSFEVPVPGNGGVSEMLPRRGLESPVSGPDGTLSAVYTECCSLFARTNGGGTSDV